MSGNMVSLKDYEGIQGFGFGSSTDVEQLNKALSAGSGRAPLSTGGGEILRVESLEATLRVTTYTLGHIKFWKMLSKLPAFSTSEEYNLLRDYGSNAGAFTNEGDLPESQDSVYERKSAMVKFLGTTREVTHPMTLVRPAHGNVIGLETQNGAIWLLERLERALFGARSDMVSQEFDGLIKQILDGVGITTPATMLYDATDVLAAGSETVVIDKRGGDVTEDDLETVTNFVVENYGTPTDLMFAPKAMSNIAKQFYPRERVNLPAPQDGKVGFAVTSFLSQAGLIQFHPDIFLRPGRGQGVCTAPTAQTSPKAPNAPTVVAGAAAPDTKSMFKAGSTPGGTFIWQVTAINRFGESTAGASGAQAVANGSSSLLTITDGGGTYPATAYKIYRSIDGGAAATSLYLTMIARPGAGPITYTDRNWFLPKCSNGLLVQNNIQNFSVRQLAPMLKIPLATVAASIRWMQLLYLVLVLYTPRKNVLFINVKDS